MKRLLSILFFSLLSVYSQAQITLIPDPDFEAKLVQLGIDSDGLVNGQILNSDAVGVTSLDLRNSSISDFTGLAAFSDLTYLRCEDNQLTSIDLSSNPALTSLHCYRNQLTSIDLSSNPTLNSLSCENNLLTSIDLSSNPALTSLTCHNNQLTSIDLSSNPALTSLNCYRNQLTSIDLSSNPTLNSLNCYSNQLTSIDLSSNPALNSLDCSSNQLTSIDLSSNPALTSLNCYRNQLTSLDLSSNPALTSLTCHNNQLTSIDLSSNPALTSLNCYRNQLTSLDLSSNPALNSLDCSRNQLTSIDLSSNPALNSLDCSRNQLTSIDLSSNPALNSLYCSRNQLTSIDLSSNPALNSLACGNNQLTSLDLSNNSNLYTLSFNSNYLTYINVKNNSSLSYFDARSNLHNLIICVNDSIAVSRNSYWLKDLSAVYTEIGPNTILVGAVQSDLNNNCQVDALEPILKDVIVQISTPNSTIYKVSNTSGRYAIELDPGTYTLSTTSPYPYISPCLNSQSTSVDSINDLDTVNWALQTTHYCPYLEASIAAPFLRMTGGGSRYTINYCNKGTAPAYAAYIEVALDPFLNVLGTGLPIMSQVGNIYTFNLDTLDIGECGSFNINVIVDTSAQVGQVHCAEVHIYPDSLCNNTWTGSIIEAEGICANNTVTFTLENVGSAMTTLRNYQIIENGTILSTTSFLLGAGDSLTVQVPALVGRFYRIEAEQEVGFPSVLGPHIAYANIERCNGNSANLRTVLRQYNGDPTPWIDIDCQPSIAAYDPNDKTAQQIGFGSQNYIERGTPLDYKVRFQNTGNDTAFHIAIFDTISPHLDLSTLQMKTASHHYTWQIVDERTLRIDFPNIKLVDSIANEPLSHGFFRYEIQQMPNLPLETVINNQAAIYFDYNPPIFTNTSLHTIGENVTSTNSLPVDWLYFEGTTDNKVNFLTWGTETEDNTAHFNIQRSKNGFNFQKIGQVDAQGQSIQNTHYTFNDVHPFEGANYYRLELVDIDGTLTYSNIILLNIGQADLVYNFFPNPTDGILYYQYQAEKAEALEIKVVNVLGQLMEQKEHQTTSGINNILTDLSPYPAGTYIIRVHHKNTGHIHTTKVIKNKS